MAKVARTIMLSLALAFCASSAVFAQSALEKLRDEGISNIGWVAGNTYGHPIWPQMKPYVGKGGEYYNFFISLGAQTANQEAQAYANIQRYNEWFDRGQSIPFNEPEAMRRAQRSVEIVSEIGELLK